MKTLMMLSLIAIMTIGVAKADEKSVTPKQFVTNVAEVPSKISNHLKNEWEDIKVYQKNSWNNAKKKWPFNMIFKGDNAS